MKETKPCPICKKNNFVYCHNVVTRFLPCWGWVACENCGIYTNITLFLNRAIKKWNKRELFAKE